MDRLSSGHGERDGFLDVVVFPSMPLEAFPLTLLEACLWKAVIAVRCRGVKEIIEDG